MRPRSDLIEQFSSFAELEADRFRRWATDGRLGYSMRKVLERSPQSPRSESYWALYWFRHWQQSLPLAASHLAAYMQEVCYWSALQTTRRFDSKQYGLADYFQMAIADLPLLWRDYSVDRGASLKTYASLVIPRLLRDRLRQYRAADLCTNWALLRKVSKKRLLESLTHAGLSADALGQYRLAWSCFNEVYVPQSGGGKLPEVNGSLWQTVAQRYNSDRHSVTGAIEATPATIEQWLTKCAGWIRSYLYPPVRSLNMARPGQETGELQDTLADEENDSLLDQWIAEEESQERGEQRSQVSHTLLTAIGNLDETSQSLLQLYYKDGLTQQQMVKQTQMSQATVSRRLTRSREALLNALVEWSRSQMNIPVTSNLIKDMGTALDEWLTLHYGTPNGSADQT